MADGEFKMFPLTEGHRFELKVKKPIGDADVTVFYFHNQAQALRALALLEEGDEWELRRIVVGRAARTLKLEIVESEPMLDSSEEHPIAALATENWPSSLRDALAAAIDMVPDESDIEG